MTKTSVYAFLLMLFIFMTPIYYCVTTALQIPPHYLGQTVAVFTVIAFLLYVFCKRPFETKELVCFFFLIIFGILFYTTRILYGYDNSNYITRFDGWLSLGNSSVLVGMLLTKKYSSSLYEKMMAILPFVVIFITSVVAPRILLGSDSTNGQFMDEFGLDYQSNAYYMALMFACSAYYVFIYKPSRSKMGGLFKPLMLVLMAINALFCAMAGGRGGFLLLLVYTLLFAWFLVKNKKIGKGHIFLIVLIGIVFFLIFANVFELSNATGYERAFNYSEHKRTDLWVTYIPIFLENPILGHGLGSVFYVSEFYSHNLIIDMLVETGIIGTLFIMSIYTWLFLFLFKKSKTDPLAYFVLLLFVYQFVVNFFSLYWIDSSLNWIAFGFFISYKLPKLPQLYNSHNR